MIDPRELRIGNIVHEKSIINNIIETTIESITRRGINYEWDRDSGYETSYDKLSGIPLSEDWLLKFGFVKGKHNHNMFKNEATFLSVDRYGQIWSQNNRRIEFVHQIQNYHYAVSGSELTLKKETA